MRGGGSGHGHGHPDNVYLDFFSFVGRQYDNLAAIAMEDFFRATHAHSGCSGATITLLR